MAASPNDFHKLITENSRLREQINRLRAANRSLAEKLAGVLSKHIKKTKNKRRLS